MGHADNNRAQKEWRARMAMLNPWFHNIELVPGVWTNPSGEPWGKDYPLDRWAEISPFLPENLSKVDVLDVGCNSGFFSRELLRRGCRSVTAIDTDPLALRQAEMVRLAAKLEYGILNLSVYDVLSVRRRFQLVLCLGVLYHLRHPLLALDRLREVLDGRMILICNIAGPDYLDDQVPQCIAMRDLPDKAYSVGFPGCKFIEHSLAFDDPTNWWIPNPAGLRAMIRSSGFTIVHQFEGLVVCK